MAAGTMLQRLKSGLKSTVNRTGARYSFFSIFAINLADDDTAPVVWPSGYRCREVTKDEVAQASSELMRAEAWYGGDGALGYGVFKESDLVCLQWIWYGERHRKGRSDWPLTDDEAESVQLITVPSERGRGLATLLKKHSALELRKHGFARLCSRIWWNHYASIRVSEKAGWRRVGTAIEIRVPFSSRPWRVIRRKRWPAGDRETG